MTDRSSHKAVLAGRAAAPAPRAPRLLLFEREDPGGGEIFGLLGSIGLEAVRCPDGRALVEEAIRRPPDAVIYRLTTHDDEDLGVLELLRRAAPAVPLILVASCGSLMTQKLMQGLRPMYTIVEPVESAELREVMEAALAPRARGGGIV
jgi:DNA-binding response OmpR family regulator